MKRTFLPVFFAVNFAALLCLTPRTIFAVENHTGEDASFFISALPAQYAYVEGSEDKFQAHNWMKARYTGGVDEFLGDFKAPEDVDIHVSGRGLLDQDTSLTRNDYEGALEIEKEDFGYFKLEFEEFPKYYDTHGGVYHPFRLFSGSNLERDLELDIGKLIVEAGIRFPDVPKIDFEYEREFKDGAKSRLTWGNAVESGLTRKIAPSWQEIHEIVHAFNIKAEHDIQDYTVKGEQHWEFIESENRRYEKNLGATYSQKFYNIQTQNPEAAFMSSTIGVERWYKKETAFTSVNYRYARVKNSEQENLREYDEFLNPMSFSSNAEQKFNARADNQLDSHTTVLNLMGLPWSWLTVNTKIKSELIRVRGNSTYPSDIADAGGFTAPNEAPNGIIDQTTLSDNKNRTFRNGQGLSIRFKKIPRTALYSEVEVEETRNWMTENRWSLPGERAAATDDFNRRTVIDMVRGGGALGFRTSPVKYVSTTAQARYRYDNVTFSDKRETMPTSSTAKSAFFDEMDTQTTEFNTKTTLRLIPWLQPSFRFIARDIDYLTRTEGEAHMDSDLLVNDYIYDLTFSGIPGLITTASFAREQLATKTAASSVRTGRLPGYNADVDSWLLSNSYTPNETISLSNVISVSAADNYDDYTSIGIPLGAEFNRVTVILSAKWNVTQNLALEPEYALYRYQADPKSETGSYTAHVFGFEVSYNWG